MSKQKAIEPIGLSGLKKMEAITTAKRELDKKWEGCLESIGLGSESGERLTRLIALHLMVDRGITELLTWQFVNLQSAESYRDIEAAVADLPISKRINLIKSAKLISDSCLKHITTLNSVRNRLAHCDPKHRYELKHVEEISSEKSFYVCVTKALTAISELNSATSKTMDEIEKRHIPNKDSSSF